MSTSGAEKLRELKEEIRRFFVGYDDVVELLLTALVSEGHVLLEGPPGVGKTLLAKTFALATGGTFKRIQMTPDLLPADILGTTYFDVKSGGWKLRKGPIHANVVLIDEINRATPRTQSALLEAMQERQVTIEGRTIQLPRPFLVVATRVPYLGEGTYQLPQGEMDRFPFSAALSYPDPAVESSILAKIDEIEELAARRVVSTEDIVRVSEEARKVHVSEKIRRYIVGIVNELRRREEAAYGPSPRASIWMLKGARALAYLDSRDYVAPDDVKSLAENVLRHRVEVKPEYRLDGVTPESLIKTVLESVEVPKA